MPRAIKVSVEHNFINGLITEATGLNFPENACTETNNCVFHPKGDVYRRLGVDYEPSSSLKLIDRAGNTVNTFLWQNAAGLADTHIVVLQAGSILYFYLVSNTAPVSAGAFASVVDISTFATGSPTLSPLSECQFSYGQGYLFVVHPNCTPFYVSYNSSLGTFSGTAINMKVRDMKGIVDELGTNWDTRPTTLTNEHKYNLFNQGWGTTPEGWDLVDYWKNGYGGFNAYFKSAAKANYPSNADVFWLFRDPNKIIDFALNTVNLRGNTPAPKGHYVYDAFNIDRSTVSGITGIPVVSSGGIRPKSTAFFAGRVWYAGVDANGFATTIYYSQIAKDPLYFGLCHQQNDPTNEYLFDLLATDGGTIDILDVGSIVKLVVIQTSLLVFSTNGVWAITGNQGLGFSPNDFSIRKVTSIPALTSSSFVDIDGLPMWWNNDGIYAITSVNQAGAAQVESISERTIKQFFSSIPVENKKYVKGAYNVITKQVQWIYRTVPITTVAHKYEFNSALIYNTSSKAFYSWSFPNQEVKINGIVTIRGPSTSLTDVYTYDINGNPVLDGNGEPIVSRSNVTALTASVFKYVVSSNSSGQYNTTFAETLDTSYFDFKTFDSVGKDYESSFTTGYKVPTGALATFQDNYISIVLGNKDQSTIKLQSVWDYGTSIASGRYGATQLIEFDEQKRAYRVRKLKVRGTGKALQLRFKSVTGKPFNLAGWTRFETQNKSP